MSDQISVVLEYHHPDEQEPTRYAVWMSPDAIGTVLLAMDALSDLDDPDDIGDVSRRIQEATQ